MKIYLNISIIVLIASFLFIHSNTWAEEKNSENNAMLESNLGKKVTVKGIAEARKLGAALKGDNFCIWIDGIHYWPNEYVGKQVEVTGILIERHDLPVFIPKDNEPLIQGIPVPEGTDLKKASRRLLLKNATWKLKE